jgi:hypothetical protein
MKCLAFTLMLAFLVAAGVRGDIQVVPPGSQITGGGGSGGGGASTSDNNDWTGTNQFTSTVRVYETATHTGNNWLGLSHSGTEAAVAAGGGDLRLSSPISGIVKITGHVQTNGNAQGFSAITAGSTGYFPILTTLTPDSGALATGASANSINVFEAADGGFDFNNGNCGTSVCADPALILHSRTQSTTQYLQMYHNTADAVFVAGTGNFIFSGGSPYLITQDTSGNGISFGPVLAGRPRIVKTTQNALYASLMFGVDEGSRYAIVTDATDTATNLSIPAVTNPTLIFAAATPSAGNYLNVNYSGTSGGFRKTLTESSATSVIRIPVAASAGTGGLFRYCVFAADATDQQSRCGRINFAVVNKAATETCTLGAASEAADGSVLAASSATTLTYAITCDTTPANAVDIQINAVSSLTQTTLELRGKIDLVGPGEPLPQ